MTAALSVVHTPDGPSAGALALHGSAEALRVLVADPSPGSPAVMPELAGRLVATGGAAAYVSETDGRQWLYVARG